MANDIPEGGLVEQRGRFAFALGNGAHAGEMPGQPVARADEEVAGAARFVADFEGQDGLLRKLPAPRRGRNGIPGTLPSLSRGGFGGTGVFSEEGEDVGAFGRVGLDFLLDGSPIGFREALGVRQPFVDHGVEGGVEEALDEAVRRVVGAGGLAFVAGELGKGETRAVAADLRSEGEESSYTPPNSSEPRFL